MQPVTTDGGDLSQDSNRKPAHRTPVTVDPAGRRGKQLYSALSASSVGLELGISVVLGLLFGMFLDKTFGTEPWLMLVFLGFGLVAGFRGVLRYVRASDKAAAREAAEAAQKGSRG